MAASPQPCHFPRWPPPLSRATFQDGRLTSAVPLTKMAASPHCATFQDGRPRFSPLSIEEARRRAAGRAIGRGVLERACAERHSSRGACRPPLPAVTLQIEAPSASPRPARMVGVKLIANDTEFQPELSAAGSRLAVVKFTMRGCGPCLRIAPAFNALSNKYPQATFLEVDVHQCQGTAATNNISATPTFLFFRNKVRIDQYQGADAVGLEEKIKQHLENDPGNNEDTDIPKGYMDLMPFINKAGCECLNESDEHGFDNCLRKDSTYLESDCDEQLLITVAFSQPVKLYSMKLQGPDNGQGPKYIKIFINLPRSMDFEEAERSEPTQALELTPDDIKEDGIIQLRYVKFQNVNSVTLFVQSNHGDEETTRITYFTFIGTPVQATNMNDFKRVVGKKGESH